MRCRTTIERGARAGRTVLRLLALPVLSRRPQRAPPLSRIIRIAPQEGADRNSLHRILVEILAIILRGFPSGLYSELIKHLGIYNRVFRRDF